MPEIDFSHSIKSVRTRLLVECCRAHVNAYSCTINWFVTEQNVATVRLLRYLSLDDLRPSGGRQVHDFFFSSIEIITFVISNQMHVTRLLSIVIGRHVCDQENPASTIAPRIDRFLLLRFGRLFFDRNANNMSSKYLSSLEFHLDAILHHCSRSISSSCNRKKS